MRPVSLVCFFLADCAAIVEPGHRGLLFEPRGGGLQRNVLEPGRHWTGPYGRIDDFDVTYSTHKEVIQTTSSEGLQLDLDIAVIYRPVATELYELDTEIGPNYYEEVVGPEFRSAARGVFARHGYADLLRQNEAIEDEIEAALRRRIEKKHVEISSVTLEGIHYAPEIAREIRDKLVSEQQAARQKVAIENEALRNQLELEHHAEEARIKAEAEIRAKQNEMALAKEQIALDEVRAKADAVIKTTHAKAEAEEISLLAKAHGEEKRAEALALTPLAVMMHGYDALEKLGGNGTTIMLGDFSHVPNFLFPKVPAFHFAFDPGEKATQKAATE